MLFYIFFNILVYIYNEMCYEGIRWKFGIIILKMYSISIILIKIGFDIFKKIGDVISFGFVFYWIVEVEFF